MWLIIRTDSRKEAYVARQLQNMGFNAWNPVQVIACRPSIARRITAKAQLQAYREVSILPRRVFVQVQNDYPSLPYDFVPPRHAVQTEVDGDMLPIRIPDSQISAFRAVIDAENTAALALSQKASRRQKAKWRDLKEALVELIDGAKAQLEQAA